MNKEKQFVSAVVYVKDCEEVISQFLTILDQGLFAHFDRYEIICVNDSSTDGSKEKIESFICSDPRTTISIINMSFAQGLELSMTAGVDLAIGDFVFEFDEPFYLFESEDIFKTYLKAIEGFDIVNVAPDLKPLWTSKVFYALFNRFANLQYTLGSEVYRILSRRAINRVRGMSETSPYRKALYANSGLKMTTRKCPPSEEGALKHKNGFGSRSALAVDALILFTDLGYRFSIIMTFIMMLITVIVALYAVIVYVFQNPVEGWTPTILFLSFTFFGIFGVMAVVIKYLSIIVNLIFKKQKYIYESIQKISRT